MDTTEGFSSKRTAEIVGVTYRQLDYWTRTGLIQPALEAATGSGSRRRYDYRNLLELKAVKTLLDAGIRLELIRDVFAYLSEHLDEDVTRVNLVISGNKSVTVRSGEEIVELLRKGQGVLNILPLAGVKEELDSTIVELYPDREPAAGERGHRAFGS